MAINIGAQQENEEDRAQEYLELAAWLSRLATELGTTYPKAAKELMSVAGSYQRMAEKLTRGSYTPRANHVDSWEAQAESFEAL